MRRDEHPLKYLPNSIDQIQSGCFGESGRLKQIKPPVPEGLELDPRRDSILSCEEDELGLADVDNKANNERRCGR